MPYTDEYLGPAIQKISNFEADFGGTEIYQPLNSIFRYGKSTDCVETHVFLLTDGAVGNT